MMDRKLWLITSQVCLRLVWRANRLQVAELDSLEPRVDDS